MSQFIKISIDEKPRNMILNVKLIKYILNLEGKAAFVFEKELIVSEDSFNEIANKLPLSVFKKVDLIRESLDHNIEKNGTPIEAFVNIQLIFKMYEEPYYGGVIDFQDGERIGSAQSLYGTLNAFNLEV